MKFHDLLDLSVGNLWRIKLRAFLTVAGVLIAIATFVAMMSFAAGNQKFVSDAYQDLGLLMNINVWPKSGNAASDTSSTAVLNQEAIRKLAAIPGVKQAYPFVDIDVKASVGDTTVTTNVRGLTLEAMTTKLYASILEGLEFSADSAREAVVTDDFLEMVGVESRDSLVGKTLVISTKAVSLDSALIHAFGGADVDPLTLMSELPLDSLVMPRYREQILRREVNSRLGLFFDGLINHQLTVADTLTIIGVSQDDDAYGTRTAPIVITEGSARKLSSAGLGVGSNPADLFSALQSGSFFGPTGALDSRSYPRVTLETEPTASHEAIVDSVEAMGYRAYSFAEGFKEIRRFFVYFYLGLSVVGLIALLTASLGIINTMVMSITERRREIGVLKALGADEMEIRLAFLTESAVIGAIGAIVGIFFGWIGTRIAAAVIRIIMERENMLVFDPFSLPPWLILLAFAFGVLVALVAGLYPAARAARVDPVEALRSE
ncbi:MAG: ABC transporter permease [Candidatus Latescibacterota bacterium]|nr:MAG: ABC transporter permease [Candidatus Latescibacterota bacterium]